MKKTKLVFQAIMLILKNATIIIPLIEGVVNSIYNFNHPPKESNHDVTEETK